MINKVKAYFKTLAKECNKTELKEKVKNIVKHPDLTEEERWLVYYTYGEERMVLNTCHKLSMWNAYDVPNDGWLWRWLWKWLRLWR